MDKELARKSLTVAALLLVLPFSLAWALNRSEFEADKSRIDEVYDAERDACADRDNLMRRACVLEAKAKHKLSLAELRHAFSGQEVDRIQLLRARAESDYLRSRQPCTEQTAGTSGGCLLTASAESSRS